MVEKFEDGKVYVRKGSTKLKIILKDNAAIVKKQVNIVNSATFKI